MKHCRLCRFSEDCKDLPGYCLLLNWVAILILLGTLGWLFYSGVS